MLITRQTEPDNLETPFDRLGGLISEAHSVRSQFPVPPLDPASFRLEVTGPGRSPRAFSLDDLRRLPVHTRRVTMECAGNGRVYLSPRASGVQWELGAVGTAQWTGVLLSAVLQEAGVPEEVTEAVLVGLDRGQMHDPVNSPGPIAYARSLPLATAQEDVLLAYEMNGAPLSPAHGAPLRAIVPGWYGMAAVKWLGRVHLQAGPYPGYFQTVDYARWEEPAGLPAVRVPLAEMQVKSQIARPAPHETLSCGQAVQLLGAAWTGQGEVTRVEVSTDGGESWADAEFLDAPEAGVWRRWRMSWTPAAPGAYTLLSRAHDSAGHSQPREHDPLKGSYEIHHTLPVPVTVRP